MAQVVLVLGGARSGKSRFAEAEVRRLGRGRPVYIATAQAYDDEMTARIAQHQSDRGDDWLTVEAPQDLPAVLRRHATGSAAVLVDCLTLWLSNRLLADADLDADAAELLAALDAATAPVVLVSNEVGLGIVPDNALARRFRDAAGRLNQEVAAAAGAVHFIAAGLPLRLK